MKWITKWKRKRRAKVVWHPSPNPSSISKTLSDVLKDVWTSDRLTYQFFKGERPLLESSEVRAWNDAVKWLEQRRALEREWPWPA